MNIISSVCVCVCVCVCVRVCGSPEVETHPNWLRSSQAAEQPIRGVRSL